MNVGSIDGMVCLPSSIWVGWAVCLSSFWLSLQSLFFPPPLCVTLTLFVFLASVFALLSARYRYLSVRSSVFRFDSSGVLFSQSCVLLRSVYCAERVGPSPFSTYTDSFLFLPSVLSFYLSSPSQIAELLHIVHTCLVPRCNMCIS